MPSIPTALIPTAFWLVVAFLFGINIGSFLNVVIWRLPRGGSISEPTWSYCPRCEHRLGALDLVPVFSFLLLGRRCRYCKEPISWRYPSIELLTGLLFVAVTWRFGGTVDSVFYCLFVAAMVCVFFIDLEHFVIPDGLNVTAALIGIAHGATAYFLKEPGQLTTVGGVTLLGALAGGLLYAAIIYGIGLLSYMYLVGIADKRKNPLAAGWEYLRENAADWAWIALYYAGALIPPLRRFVEPPEPLEGTTADEIESDEDAGGMGGGDGKLAMGIGANLAVLGSSLLVGRTLIALVSAIFLGAMIGVVVLIKQRKALGGRTAIPFGPSMVIGALVALFVGDAFLKWYLSLFVTPTQNVANLF